MGVAPSTVSCQLVANMGFFGSFLKCFLLTLALVFGVLCLAGGIAFCVLYYVYAVQQGVSALDARVSAMQSRLNQSEFLMMDIDRQIASAASPVEAQVQMFGDDVTQFMTDTNTDRTSLLNQARTDFMTSLNDNGISAAIATAEQQTSTFIMNVATSISNQLAQLNTSLDTSLGSFNTALDGFEAQIGSDWADIITSVNARVALSGEAKTYVRYGASTCPNTAGTTLVYSGYNVGTAWNSQGGGSNFVCVPTNPEYVLPSERTDSVLHGSEYESAFHNTQNENIPCAVCSVPNRPEIIMVPAKMTCPDSSWTSEYRGWVHSENRGNWRSSFLCIDEGMEAIPGKTGNQVGSDLWLVEARCAFGLPCPPYREDPEMHCVVCSK